MLIKLRENMDQNTLLDVCGCTAHIANTKEISYIATDSRKVCEGSLFAAIKGENTDGHLYLDSAVKNGACAVMVEADNPNSAGFIARAAELGCSVFEVENTTVSFGRIAKRWLSELNIPVAAVTGSVGKTTTKQLLASVLMQKYTLKKTEGNHNNELGLPYTVLSLERTDEMAVLEMGMSGSGEISYLSRLANPALAVITNVGTSHIENLGSREGIAKAKLEITDGMSAGSLLILNGDEPLLTNTNKDLSQLEVRYVSAKDPSSDVFLYNVRSYAEGYTLFDLKIGGEELCDLRINAIGEHIAFDASLAAAAGLYLGLDEQMIRRGLEEFENTGMRQKITHRAGCTVIEDCYNASCEAMVASLGVLREIAEQNSARAIAVLGEMRELGDYSDELHCKVGAEVASQKISKLFVFGKKALPIAQGALSSGFCENDVVIIDDVSDKTGLASAIKAELKTGDVILFKASRAIALEEVIEQI